MTLFVCNGFGKGKSTSAIGTTLRALANHESVLFVQFLKDGNDLALKYLKSQECFKETFLHMAQGLKGFDISDKSAISATIEFFNNVKELITSRHFDLIVFDELNVAQDYKMLGLMDNELLEYLKQWVGDTQTDAYVTGRLNRYDLRHAIYSIADIATNMRCEAHSYNKVCKVCGMEFSSHFEYCPMCGKKLRGGHKAKRGREF